MNREEVLQKVNDYCTEKQYTTATLTDAFKNKFVDHFLKANPEGNIEDESLLASLKFNLNTAFSSASELATIKVNEFVTKENEYKRQIEELRKTQQTQHQTLELPQEVQDQLDELKAFKDSKTKQEKLASILTLAKSGIRTDLHASFDKYASKYQVQLDKEDKEQADALVAEYYETFKDIIGDIKPKSPQQTQKQVEEFIAAIPRVKVS